MCIRDSTWDSVERGTVNAAGAVASSLDGPIDAFRDYMKANEEAQEATDALTREMMRSEGWSQGFKDLSASAGDTAASLLGMSDVVANFQRVLNDPAAYEQAANGLTIEREKAELMQREAHFAELQQKALEKIYKDQEAHLEAQAAASVVYGPELPPKEEKKKKGPKRKTALDLVKSTEFVHDESMGFGRNDALEALDTEVHAWGCILPAKVGDGAVPLVGRREHAGDALLAGPELDGGILTETDKDIARFVDGHAEIYADFGALHRVQYDFLNRQQHIGRVVRGPITGAQFDLERCRRCDRGRKGQAGHGAGLHRQHLRPGLLQRDQGAVGGQRRQAQFALPGCAPIAPGQPLSLIHISEPTRPY